MSIGMTYEQYWFGDTRMARAFYQAEKIRQEQIDANAWLFGSYVGQAIEATIGNAFRKSGIPPQKYPEYPRLTEQRMKEEEERRQGIEQEERDKTFALAWMSNFVQAGKNWGKKG